MTFLKGLAPSQLWSPQNTGHYKWVPAFAGMKRSRGDMGSTGEKVLNSNKRVIHEEHEEARRIFQGIIVLIDGGR